MISAFLILFNYYCVCLKPIDLCKTKINGSKSICSKPYPYECGKEYCSSSKLTCIYFKSLSFSVRIQKTAENYEQKQIKYTMFKSQIAKCLVNTYKWKPGDVCIHPKKCFQKKRLPLRTGDTYILKQVECSCKNDFGYKCHRQGFCSKHKTACDTFKAKVASNKTADVKIKYCSF